MTVVSRNTMPEPTMLAIRTVRLISRSRKQLSRARGQHRVRLVAGERHAAGEGEAAVDDHAVAPRARGVGNAGAIDHARLDRQQADELQVAAKRVGRAV